MQMAFPTLEFAIAPATEAFRANPRDVSVVEPTVDILKSSKGNIEFVVQPILIPSIR